MTEDAFQALLADLWERVIKYEIRFGDRFEICFLVSRAAQQYRAPTIYKSYTVQDPFDHYTYLLGHRVIFTDQEYIYNMVSDLPGLIEPVICCKDTYSFPMQAELGDYVLFANHLKQIVEVDYEDGERVINVKDIPGRLGCDLVVDSKYWGPETSLADKWMDFKNKRDREKDAWMLSVDNEEINEYLSSLTII